MPAKGIKKQVLGGVLFCLGMMTALLARMLGFELDSFYVVISIFGAALFLYGAIQKSRHKLAVGAQHVDRLCTESAVVTETQPHGTNFTARTNLTGLPASMGQRVSIHRD